MAPVLLRREASRRLSSPTGRGAERAAGEFPVKPAGVPGAERSGWGRGPGGGGGPEAAWRPGLCSRKPGGETDAVPAGEGIAEAPRPSPGFGVRSARFSLGIPESPGGEGALRGRGRCCGKGSRGSCEALFTWEPARLGCLGAGLEEGPAASAPSSEGSVPPSSARKRVA